MVAPDTYAARMTLRVWARSALAAVGVGALTGAGQLGLAYGLGILVWDQDYVTGSANAWYAQLAWVCFFAITAVLAGTAAGVFLFRRLSGPANPHDDLAGHAAPAWTQPDPRKLTGAAVGLVAALAAAASVGALLIMPLVMLPAGEAKPWLLTHPSDIVRSVAIWGLVLGFIAAILAHIFRPVGWSMSATVGWVWLAGLLASIRDISQDTDGTGQRLGLPLTPLAARSAGNTLILLILLGVGLVIGVGVALAANRLREPQALVVAGGVAGPVLLMVSYLVAGKGISAAGQYATDQLVPYRAAPFAALIALFGATFVAILAHRPKRRGHRPGPAGDALLGPGPAAGRHAVRDVDPTATIYPEDWAKPVDRDDWRTATSGGGRRASGAPAVAAASSAAASTSSPVSAAPATSPAAAAARPGEDWRTASKENRTIAGSDLWPGGKEPDDKWSSGASVSPPVARSGRRKETDSGTARSRSDLTTSWPGGAPLQPVPAEPPRRQPRPEPEPARPQPAPARADATTSWPGGAPLQPIPAEPPATPGRTKRGLFRKSASAPVAPAAVPTRPERGTAKPAVDDLAGPRWDSTSGGQPATPARRPDDRSAARSGSSRSDASTSARSSERSDGATDRRSTGSRAADTAGGSTSTGSRPGRKAASAGEPDWMAGFGDDADRASAAAAAAEARKMPAAWSSAAAEREPISPAPDFSPPAERKKGLFRRGSKSDTAGPAPTGGANPARPAGSASPKNAAKTGDDSRTAASGAAKGGAAAARAGASTERSSSGSQGSLFTPVEAVPARSASGLFSPTDSHPVVPPESPRGRGKAPEPPARPAMAEPQPPEPSTGEPSRNKRQARKAEKVAREQARVEYERQRSDNEFDDWLGKIAPPRTARKDEK
jgi:hypothetical protein